MLEHVTGDLISNLHRHSVILHGVNVQGAFGAGFAAVLKTAYPNCVPVYMQACGAHMLLPGQIVIHVPSTDSNLPRVIHVATQEFYGRKGRARIDWVRSALQEARSYLDANSLAEVAMPKIASGLGGLAWNTQVLPVLNDIFGSWQGKAIVYTLDT